MAGPEAYFPLLRMSIGLQNEPKRSDESVKEMDPERRTWLKEAMANLLKSPVDDMKAAIKTIKETEDEEEKVKTVESLVGYVEQIDLARDLHKIGGLSLIISLLDDSYPRVRASAASVLGSAVHNNPEPQKWAMELGGLESLTKLLNREDATPEELTKAVFGLSSLIRQNDIAFVKFIKELKAFPMLLNILKTEKFSAEAILPARRKAVFFILYLVNRAPAILSATVGHTVPILIKALELHVEDPDFRENAVQVLHVYVKQNIVTDKAMKESIGASVTQAQKLAKGEEHDSVVETCQEILKSVQ